MNDRRIHYLTGWPSTTNFPEPHIACEDEEGDWNADDGFVTCPDCLLALGDEHGAHMLRKAEVDQWLDEIGTHVIQVRDLGAAMEARELGGRIIDHVTGYAMIPWAHEMGSYIRGLKATHLARVALGEAQ